MDRWATVRDLCDVTNRRERRLTESGLFWWLSHKSCPVRHFKIDLVKRYLMLVNVKDYEKFALERGWGLEIGKLRQWFEGEFKHNEIGI